MPDRPTMIMLPAMPCGEGFYAAQQAALADLVDCRVMVMDRPSLGESAAAVLAAAPPRFLLAGTAYGGSLAVEIALTAPERIAGLWLMNTDPGPHPDPARAHAAAASLRAGGLENLLADWATFIVAEDATAARQRFLALAREAGAARFARQYEALAARRDHWAGLHRLTMPALLLWGEEDRFIPLATGRRMAAAMADARLVSLPGCRHFPALEQPDAVNRVAREWLASILPPA